MKLTEKQINQTLGLLSEKVSGEFIQEIMDDFPEGSPFGFIQGPIVNSVRKHGSTVSVEQVMSDVKAELEAKKPAPENIKRPGDTKRITRDYYDSLLIEQRLMDVVLPDTTSELFGEQFASPIMTTALSHLGPSNHGLGSGMCEYAAGAKLANSLHWIGMCEDEEFIEYMSMGAKSVRIVKPYKDDSKIYRQLQVAREQGCVAVGMDIDHMLTNTGSFDIVLGEEMEAKSSSQLREFIEAAKLPFVIKGVLSARDAAKACEIGASAILVSHHGGRMSYAVPPLMVLPEIVKAVDGRCKIFVDCGIASGMDAYKALALGADAVGVGGHLMSYVKQGGSKAVGERLETMTAELRGVMAYTGVKNTRDFDATVIHRINER